jgi:hypothetical protein
MSLKCTVKTAGASTALFVALIVGLVLYFRQKSQMSTLFATITTGQQLLKSMQPDASPVGCFIGTDEQYNAMFNPVAQANGTGGALQSIKGVISDPINTCALSLGTSAPEKYFTIGANNQCMSSSRNDTVTRLISNLAVMPCRKVFFVKRMSGWRPSYRKAITFGIVGTCP